MPPLALVYQSDPATGTPKLKAMDGDTVPFSPDETREFETLLAKNYNDLSRRRKPTIEFHARQFQVTVEGQSRMPKLVLREASQVLVPMSAVPPTWLDGLLAELSQRVAEAGDTLGDFERNQLEFALREFQAQARLVDPLHVAYLLFAVCLGSQEQQVRLQNPSRAALYATALRSFESLLVDPANPDGTRALTVIIRNTPQPEGVVKRVLNNLFGHH